MATGEGAEGFPVGEDNIEMSEKMHVMQGSVSSSEAYVLQLIPDD